MTLKEKGEFKDARSYYERLVHVAVRWKLKKMRERVDLTLAEYDDFVRSVDRNTALFNKAALEHNLEPISTEMPYDPDYWIKERLPSDFMKKYYDLSWDNEKLKLKQYAKIVDIYEFAIAMQKTHLPKASLLPKPENFVRET